MKQNQFASLNMTERLKLLEEMQDHISEQEYAKGWDIEAMTDQELIDTIEREYDGGINSFISKFVK